jgi:cardiolipin synthase
VATQVQAAYNDNWTKMTGEILNGEAHFDAVPPAGAVGAQLFIASPVGGSQSMQLRYLLTITAAVRSLDIAAAYFVPDKLLLESLVKARQRGVRVRLMVPGPHTDSDAVGIASRREWGKLLKAGVEIFEYQPTMMHTKAMVVDGIFSIIGSANFGNRSFELNDELTIGVFDRELAAQLTRDFEADAKVSKRLDAQTWPKQRSFDGKINEWFWDFFGEMF